MSYGPPDHHYYGGGPGGGPPGGGPHGGPPGGHPGGHHPPPHLGHGGPQSYESSNLAAATSSIKGDVVKIYSEAATEFNLAVRGNQVVVAKANDSDPYQEWIKDESWSNKAKDSAGHPGFALINKGSGQALRAPEAAGENVLETTYHQNSLNASVLWSIGKNEGHGYHAIRPIVNIDLNLDIDHGSKKYGGVHDGQAVIVFGWKDEDNQKWQIKPVGEKKHHFGF